MSKLNLQSLHQELSSCTDLESLLSEVSINTDTKIESIEDIDRMISRSSPLGSLSPESKEKIESMEGLEASVVYAASARMKFLVRVNEEDDYI